MHFALALVFLLSAAADPGGAGCDSTAACLAAIERDRDATAGFRAAFTQVKHVSLLDEPIVSRGTISFRRPDRVRLEIAEPVRTVVIIAGTEIHVPGMSEADARAMAVAPLASMFSQLGALFSGDVAALQGGFEVTAEEAGGGIDLHLAPRDEAWRGAFRRVHLRFAGTPLVVREIRLEDTLGDRLEVTLADVETGVELPDSLFERPSARR